MPFCTQCGRQAAASDLYCAHCGDQQSDTPGAGSHQRAGSGAAYAADPLAGLSPRTASILCYIPTIGWIPAIIALAAKKFKTDQMVRFHAFQGLYLFAAWLVVQWVVHPLALTMPDRFVRLDRILEAGLIGVSVFMMIKVLHGISYVLPIIGELAQRSSTEH